MRRERRTIEILTGAGRLLPAVLGLSGLGLSEFTTPELEGIFLGERDIDPPAAFLRSLDEDGH